MSGITLANAQAQLQRWLDADIAVARSQSYSIDDRQLSRADAGEIRRNIDFWNLKVQALSNAASGRRRVRVIVNGG